MSASPGGHPSSPSPPTPFLAAFWRFLRPHTIRGTLLGSCAITAKALAENPALIDWGLLPRACLGVLALLAGNGYIVGINQVYDVEIDAINKPWLPIAAGDLSLPVAWALCLGLAAGGLGICVRYFGPAIAKLYATGLALGTVYSVPPLRLKRFAVSAFLIIAFVRGFLLNFGVYQAVRAALGLPFVWSPAITFMTVFVTVFATAIAITKDLPDIAGDRANNIQTFATRLGMRRVAWLGSGLLLANYVGGALAAAANPVALNARLVVPAHALLAAALTWQTARMAETQAGVTAYYRFVWYLFYAEYLLLPFI